MWDWRCKPEQSGCHFVMRRKDEMSCPSQTNAATPDYKNASEARGIIGMQARERERTCATMYTNRSCAKQSYCKCERK
eukprot:1826614-Amphidinium_carterae.1